MKDKYLYTFSKTAKLLRSYFVQCQEPAFCDEELLLHA